MRARSLALAAGVILLAPGGALADAIVRTQAMFARTIAEIHVESDAIRVRLEIGLDNLEAFPNLLPDELYEKLGHPPLAFDQRLARFFADDLRITPVGGAPLGGRLLGLAPQERLPRDDITGEPLPDAEGPAETVIVAQFEYALRGRPQTIVLQAPTLAPAGVGFVLYHEGVPVNDFRYLVPTQTLDLDWDDSWYTQFRARSLRRAYSAAMSGFLYVEPYEVRKEIIVRPGDLQSWIDLGLSGMQTIPIEMQDRIKREAAEFLRTRQPVTIDGQQLEPELAQINFLERTLRTSRVIDPPQILAINSAVLGVIFVYPTDGLPQRVTMNWDMFNSRITRVSAAAVDEAGPLPSVLVPDAPLLEWQNFLKHPTLPTLAEIVAPPSTMARAASWLRWPLALVSGILLALAWPGRRASVAKFGAALAIGLAGLGAFWVSHEARLSQSVTAGVVDGLLGNVYRAFDFRDEEQIYDVLAQSVDGELLTQTYLETRRSLELANQGGARAKVKSLDLESLESEARDDGFRALATWTVGGSVGHWGHVHGRSNRYSAELEVRPVGGVWKLTSLEVLSEERL